MKASFNIGLIILVVWLCMPADSIAQNPSALDAKVDAYIKPFVDIKGFNGSILIARQGKVLLSKGYGMANYEFDVPNTPQTKFHIASISKSITAAAILLLEERGLLSVNDSLSKYIPDYPNGQAITIHHLLIHTSGIPNVNGFPDYDAKSMFPQTLDSIIQMFKNSPLLFKPGERYSYSNSEYNLLAFIIEKVSGRTFADFLKVNIFDPLGMKDTAADSGPGPIVRNLASGYSPAGLDELENSSFLDWSIKTGNGSLYSTTEDLYKWDRAVYTEKIFKRATLEKIFTEHVRGVGYGWGVSQAGNRRLINISGRSPGFQGELQRFVDQDICIIVLSNNYSGAASFIANGLAAIVFDEPYATLSSQPRLKLDRATIEAYSGRYQGGADFFIPAASITVQQQNGYLTSTWSTGGTTWLVPMGENRFYHRNFGGVVTFVKDSSGKVSHLDFTLQGNQTRATKAQNP